MRDSTTAKHAAGDPDTPRGGLLRVMSPPPGFDAKAHLDKLNALGRDKNPTFEASLDKELAKVRELLLEKNAAYGDSALNPVNALSSASATEQIRVRMDDKLSRMVRGHEYANEDTLLDFVGYYFLLKIAEGRA